MENELRLAVLIDADNAPRTALREIMAEVAVYGAATIKRIYADWTAPNMGSWKPLLLEHAITPFQQYSYTTGKNSTDSAMIIDAMDILYSGSCGGFVLVSSDSDFTRLAIRLREAGMKVYGMGEKKTPKPFIVACDRFLYIEVLRAAAQLKGESVSKTKKEPEKVSAPAPAPKAAPVSSSQVPRDVVESLMQCVEEKREADGYALMSQVGALIREKRSDFRPKKYGFSKFSKLMESLDCFQIQSQTTGDCRVRVRPKQ